ncbi:EF-hand calcium-binding domain-containing protein 4B-like [Homarus americanus]|uniref:EF-hand calcium-binding domain-containing protein 4B-like n=1 Tax=Homarus americanus TaxID=6706 RepID=UPI001C4551DA|nr:EF-hand calcium-binding domain-containing protein 4B-like [Homarus americanus]XP_042234266.1 EF-hand calcium-binding domain-containing protein 4B-like [Homarus americanus]
MTEQCVGGAGVEEGVDFGEDTDSWEARAVELFTLCDRECKGFVTKRDLQRLWGELPLDPDEFERVFDSLDQDHNGFLSLEEFTDGFGSHLGLVVEFRAESSSSSGCEGEAEAQRQQEQEVKEGIISTQQLDTILNSLAGQDLDSNSAVVEAVWREVCGSGDGTQEDARLERLVAALLQELSRVRADHAHLEAALATKTDQYNQQVSQLYEELETQISGEETQATKEQNQRSARALALLEEEVAERERALQALEEEQQVLRQQLEQMAATEAVARQDNSYLSQHVDRLEEELATKDAVVQELTVALEALKKNTKNEKIRRVQQAFKVSEGIAMERESLVTQLDILRTINTQLRDEQDQASQPPSRCKESEGGGAPVPVSPATSPHSRSDSDSLVATTPTTAPLMDHTHTTTVTLPPRPPYILPVQDTYTSLNASHCLIHNIRRTTGSVRAADCEHDEEYFVTVDDEVSQEPVLPPLIAPMETSLLQELLQHPPLCVSCGGTLPDNMGDTSDMAKASSPRLRQESMTQTSPIESLEDLPAKVLMSAEASPTKEQSTPPEEDVESSIVGSTNSVLTRYCQCSRVGSQPPSAPRHSSTVIIYHPGHYTATQISPLHHTHHTYHTRHSYHTYYTFKPKIEDIQTKVTRNASTQSTAILSIEIEGQLDTPQASHSNNGRDVEFVTNCCTSENSILEADQQDEVSQSTQDDLHSDTVMGQCEDLKEETTQDNVMGKLVNQVADDGLNVGQSVLPSSNITLESGLVADEVTKEQLEDKFSDNQETRQIIQRRYSKNTPTILVAPLCRRYPYGEDNDNKTSELRNKGERQDEQPSVSAIERDAILYCPSRMFKVVFIGDSGVGKTSFIHRATAKEFREDFGSTVGVDYRTLEVQVGSVLAVLQLWDTAGQERFRSITRQYYRKADGVVVVYDLTCEQSFLNVVDWITSVRDTAGEEVLIALLGNKEDLQDGRCIDQDTADKLAKANNCFMFECSAATGSGVQDAMMHIASLLTNRQTHDIAPTSYVTLQEPLKKNKCCK